MQEHVQSQRLEAWVPGDTEAAKSRTVQPSCAQPQDAGRGAWSRTAWKAMPAATPVRGWNRKRSS